MFFFFWRNIAASSYMYESVILEHLPHTLRWDILVCIVFTWWIVNCWYSDSSAYPIDEYPAKTRQAAAIMLMIMNNLDPRVAQVNYVP